MSHAEATVPSMSSHYTHATIHPAAANSPVLLHGPHSSRHIPDSNRSDFLITGAELERELDESVDTATDLIAAYGARARRAHRRWWSTTWRAWS